MIIRTIFCEYGMGWVFCRALYFIKLKMLCLLPVTEKLFERRVKVKQIKLLPLPVSDIKAFLQNLPEDRKNEVIKLADNAANGILNAFSCTDLNYGNPINWHYNPLTGRNTDKNVKWYKIKDFDKEQGDIKVIWEASRFTHFLYFARAYLLTGDIKYYHFFSAQLSDWLKENPYPYGANYKCGQECSLRMMNALLAYTVFSDIVTVADEFNMKQLINRCYKKVLSNFFYAHRCIRNNHTLSELCGMMLGAWCCGDTRRLRKAYQLMDKEILRQFKPDGGYIQYSFNYQRFALQLIEYILILSRVNGMSLSQQALKRVQKSVLLLYYDQDTSGEVPNYGSNDGSLIFPLHSCGYHDFTPVINSLNALMSGKSLYKNGLHTEELIWFGGKSDYPYEELPKEAKEFHDTGIYTLRRKAGFCTVYLSDYMTRPSHMDGLHIDIWHERKNIFCDCGTYSYAHGDGLTLCRTGAHNTLKLPDHEQMESRGSFMICRWYVRKNIFYDDKVFKGTLKSRIGYEHTREIRLTEDGYQICDEVNSTNKLCELHFHTPYRVELKNHEAVIFENDELIGKLKAEAGIIGLKKTYRSRCYLQKEEINEIIISWNPKEFSKLASSIILYTRKEGKVND